jgi:hypothetical protein
MIAILTGDIVKSSIIDNEIREKILQQLSELEESIGRIKDEERIQLEVFRGDGIQIKIKDPRKALKVALLYRTLLKGQFHLQSNKKLDVRFAIGIGSIDFEKKSLAESYGEALIRSGRLLDKMKKKHSNLITIDFGDDLLNQKFDVIFSLLETTISKWTSLQSDIIHFKILGLKENSIAPKLGIFQESVNRSANSAGWWAVEKLLAYFEQEMTIELLKKAEQKNYQK